MQHFFSSDYTLGILGGGQLGKMLLYETRKYDIKTHVLDPSSEAPSRIACNLFEQGDLMNFDTVYNFGKKVDVLTFEIEAVNIEALAKLEREGKKVFPSAATLNKIQNKGIQKLFYRENNIPTANFIKFNTLVELQEAIKNDQVTIPFVWKCTEGGYDGNGVSIIKNEADIDNLPDMECIAEDLVDYKNELGVIVVRNPSGEVKTFPVVEQEFHPEANQVEYVICPARINADIREKARAVAKQVSEAFEHVGVLAVELFQTQDNEILVNEVAPRTHNSGHLTIEANYTNHFEQHLRSVLDLPLGDTENKAAGVMVNLVGAEGHTGEVCYKNIEKIMALPGVTPHIYGKRETRPFRKMGNVTIINSDINEARSIAEKVKKTIQVISE